MKKHPLFDRDAKQNFILFRGGVAMLPMILALTFIILVVVLTLTNLSISEINIGASQKKADEAYYVASGGVSDAMIRITRNKNYSNASYNVTVGSGTASVIVEKDQPAAGQSRVTSTGTVSTSKRKVEVIVTVSNYGTVGISSWTEIAP